MTNIYKKSNKLGNPIFKIETTDGACKFVFDAEGCIIKASCGEKGNLCPVYSAKDNSSKEYLKEALIELHALSEQCFNEVLAEIKNAEQLTLAKEVANVA